MKGYKGFNQDLTCRDFQYEVGKTYEMSGLIGLCSRGFHFCEKLTDCFDYYDKQSSRFCEIETGELVVSDRISPWKSARPRKCRASFWHSRREVR